MSEISPGWDDVLDGAAHIIADGDCLRASNPSTFDSDPDVPDVIIVSVYPEEAMPDNYEVMCIAPSDEPDEKTLEAAIRARYASVSLEWDAEFQT